MTYYAALVSVVELLKEITHPDHTYPKSILDKQQIHVRLYEKFNLLLELLEDYSPKDHKEESTDILERRIRDAAYHAQDIIESHISHQIPTEDKPCRVKGISRHFISAFKKAYRKLQPQRFEEPRLYNFVEKEYYHAEDIESPISHQIPTEDKPRRVKGISWNFISAFKKAYRKIKPQRFEEPTLDNIVEKEYYQDLEKVKAEVDSIVEEHMTIKESPHAKDLHLKSYICQDSAGGATKVQAPSGRKAMVVFDEDLITTIKDQLCGEPSRREVISIVGMGGLGKSTLARCIFDDKLIDEHFDRRAWVTVSQDYHLHNILLAIVDSLNIKMGELGKGKEGVLVEHIHKHLKGRRYLIVMDDMWETKVWDDVKRIFPNDNNGSRVITTTRLSNVAFYADNSGFVHQLQLLNESQSWNLFSQKVCCPPELEDIGRVIAKKCRGLPLAIVVVAGLLSKANKIRHDWAEIARNVSSAAIGNDGDFSKIISLSYKHLPHHLKPCFLYLGGFPEDYEIPVSKLIKLWVAEGFIKPIASKSLEEAGEQYLDDLINRNLVLTNTGKFNGKVSACSIHDVLRDLCLQRARYEDFLHCLHKQDDFQGELMENVRRLYIQRSDESSFLKYKKEHVSHVRAIPFFANDSVWRHFSSVASDFKLVRVLNTTHKFNSESPNAIVQLLNLRYLALPECTFRAPPSIFKLQNLQTLIVDGRSSLILPCEIWKMPHLRHVMSYHVKLPPIPHGEIRVSDGTPLLGKLQTLCTIEDFIFTRNTVKMIPSLRNLSVHWLDEPNEDINWVEIGLNNLVHLHQLESLDIRFSSWAGDVVTLPENFAFPSNLIKLSLYGSRLPWKDMTIVGSLPNLQVLELYFESFVGEEWEPIEGEFSRLKSLRMTELYDLKCWRAKNIHFPCLEHLYISLCHDLEEIPPGIGDIPTLQSIELYVNSEALNSSALRIQEEQQDLGNDGIQFRIQQTLKRNSDSDSDW